MFKNVANQKLILFAFDSTTNLPKSGDASNITGYVSKDYGAVTVLGDTTATEMDSTNAKGYYLLDLTQSETNADTLLFSAKSSTANIVVIAVPATVFTVPANFTAMSIDSNGRLDIIKVAGTTQTAKDIGGAVPAAAAGASGGLLISGSNSGTTTFGALTVTGATTYTGNVSMAAGLNITQSSSNTSALVITGNGTGHGAIITSGNGATGDALRLLCSSTNGTGLTSLGTGTGNGIQATGGSTGNGIRGLGGVTSGDGAVFAGQLSGHGLTVTGVGTTKHGINAAGGSTTSHGINAAGGGVGHGINAVGGGSAASDGIRASGGATSGYGFNCIGVGTTFAGIRGSGGATTSAGMQLVGGATSGDGLLITTTNGHGIFSTATGVGKDGARFVGAAAATTNAGGNGLNCVGGAASTSAGGTSGAGFNALGGAGAASTNGAGTGFVSTGGGTTTVSGGHGVTFLATGSQFDLNATTTDALQVNVVQWLSNGVNVSDNDRPAVDVVAILDNDSGIYRPIRITAGLNVITQLHTTQPAIAWGTQTYEDGVVYDATVTYNDTVTFSRVDVTGGLYITQSVALQPALYLEGGAGAAYDIELISGTTNLEVFLANSAISNDSFSSDFLWKAVSTGTCQSGSTSTTTKLASGESATTDKYKDCWVKITGGTGSGQIGLCTAYNGTTKVCTMKTAWTVTPDNTSAYAIYPATDPRAVQLTGSQGTITWGPQTYEDAIVYDSTITYNDSVTFGQVNVTAGLYLTQSVALQPALYLEAGAGASFDIELISGTTNLKTYLADDALTAAAIDDGAITAAKIATDAITSAKIAAGAIGSSELADGAITAAKIADNALTSAKIADDAITDAKIAVPSETSGQPSRILAMIRRSFERTANKWIRTLSGSVYTSQLRNAADSGDLETMTQTTSGSTDTQTKKV